MNIEGLKVKYKDKTVFENLCLKIENNEKVAIVGKSGEGKTSLIKALLKLVDFDGKVTNVPEFSVVFQEDRLVEELSVKENILLVCPDADVTNVLNKIGLLDSERTKVKNLSGGMKRRVAIARAMSKRCEMLVADEPFVGLDVATKAVVTERLKEFVADKGLLLVTHDLLQAYELCDRIIIIDGNGVVEDRKTSEFTVDMAIGRFIANS
ncbi:MAG: ABC transporter ATP-binding protein [Clostridia bacterium]|nr:ABC transporter ATP-binding protein [Clostridia bacterium]